VEVHPRPNCPWIAAEIEKNPPAQDGHQRLGNLCDVLERKVRSSADASQCRKDPLSRSSENFNELTRQERNQVIIGGHRQRRREARGNLKGGGTKR